MPRSSRHRPQERGGLKTFERFSAEITSRWFEEGSRGRQREGVEGQRTLKGLRGTGQGEGGDKEGGKDNPSSSTFLGAWEA